MIKRERAVPVLLAAMMFVVGLAILWPSEAQAQCALCRSGLQDNMTAKTINTAIIVLLIPPVAIFCSIFGIAYKKIREDADENSDD